MRTQSFTNNAISFDSDEEEYDAFKSSSNNATFSMKVQQKMTEAADTYNPLKIITYFGGKCWRGFKRSILSSDLIVWMKVKYSFFIADLSRPKGKDSKVIILVCLLCNYVDV